MNMHITNLHNQYVADPESGIITSYNGTVTSLLKHLSEKYKEMPKVVKGTSGIYYGWCVDNEVTVVLVQGEEVLKVRENNNGVDLFIWGEELEWKETDKGIRVEGKYLLKW